MTTLRNWLRRWLGVESIENRVGVVEVVAEHADDRAAIAGEYAITARQMSTAAGKAAQRALARISSSPPAQSASRE